MVLVVLSDIHGNHTALRLCIQDARRRTAGQRPRFVLLGDYQGDLPCPQQTMALLYELQRQEDCVLLRGNREEYLLNARKNGATGWKKGSSTSGMLLYNQQSLSPRDLHFFEGLSFARTYAPDPALPPLQLCHGSPRATKEKLFADSAGLADALTAPLSQGIRTVLCGHTHRQGGFCCSLTLPAGGTALCHVYNPGSVGMALSRPGVAEYLLLHGQNGDWQPEYITLPYDVGPVLRQMEEERLADWAPGWCATTKRLLTRGDVTHGGVLVRAMELCRRRTGRCVWPDIPEDCWQQALAELPR